MLLKIGTAVCYLQFFGIKSSLHPRYWIYFPEYSGVWFLTLHFYLLASTQTKGRDNNSGFRLFWCELDQYHKTNGPRLLWEYWDRNNWCVQLVGTKREKPLILTGKLSLPTGSIFKFNNLYCLCDLRWILMGWVNAVSWHRQWTIGQVGALLCESN